MITYQKQVENSIHTILLGPLGVHKKSKLQAEVAEVIYDSQYLNVKSRLVQGRFTFMLFL